MAISELIKRIDFCSANLREFVFEDQIKLPYFCCKTTIGKKCLEKCGECDSIYARYVVIDLTDETTKNICFSTIFQSNEKFSYFQENYLSEIFFYESDFIRYNIYLVFVYDNKDDIKEYIDYCFDLNYARKLFFTAMEFEEYFDYYKKIKGQVKESKYSMDQEILKELEGIVTRLDGKGMKSVLLDSDNDIINYFIVNPFNRQNNYDTQCGVKETVKSFIEKYIYKDKGKWNKELRDVRSIKTLKLDNFRNNCFGNSYEFRFGRANIIYGANTVGKTSLLDAIEFGFTGNIHKYKEECFKEESNVTIESNNGATISAKYSREHEDELKAAWYPYKIGSLSELFARINYFDTDATYRFALEQGDVEEAYRHIRNLLSTARLLDIEQNLRNNIDEIEKIKIFVNRDNFYFKKVLSKTKVKKSNKNKAFSLFKLFRTPKETEVIYSINEKKLEDINSELKSFENECRDTLNKITELIDRQIGVNLKLLNIIFHRLFSLNCDIIWENGVFKMRVNGTPDLITIEKMSTAQKVSLALSVIFTQFFIAADAPQIILLDESVVNFDAFHLLNLFDFLREFTLNNVQIFFTTASEDIAHIAKSKLGFLENECCIYELAKTANGEPLINQIK